MTKQFEDEYLDSLEEADELFDIDCKVIYEIKKDKRKRNMKKDKVKVKNLEEKE